MGRTLTGREAKVRGCSHQGAHEGRGCPGIVRLVVAIERRGRNQTPVS